MNVKRQGITLARGWDEIPLSSCDKRILKITQKPIADAEDTARKLVPKTRLLEDRARDRQPIAYAIRGCLGAIILSQLPLSDIHNSTTPNTANYRISESTVAAASALRHGTSHNYPLKPSFTSSKH
jgi:hypothetical protein